MIIEGFLQQFQNACYDHIPAMINIPEGVKKKRTFRLVNYIADKKKLDKAVVEKDPFNSHMKVKDAKLLNEYVEVSNDELKLLQQKAKIMWLSEGDQNTAYFHGILRSRKHKGRIESIYSLEVSFDKVLSEKEAEDMLCMVTDEEIKEAVFDIDSNKADVCRRVVYN
ncbi:hypothetical protein Tco_1443224 [Tanacetum coccineum]